MSDEIVEQWEKDAVLIEQVVLTVLNGERISDTNYLE